MGPKHTTYAAWHQVRPPSSCMSLLYCRANCTADLEEKSIYHCVRRSLSEHPDTVSPCFCALLQCNTGTLCKLSAWLAVHMPAEARSHYAPKIEKWMKAFPRREQLHILQVGGA